MHDISLQFRIDLKVAKRIGESFDVLKSLNDENNTGRQS